MSLFIRMSQTRQGAEKLLEAQFIPVLSQCDYLDSMPEADQAFMGMSHFVFPPLLLSPTVLDHDSFLPSAIQRYHQLFTPAVQAVNGIVAILGSRHSTATSHALDFLSNHASTIAILLKTQADYVTLGILEEIHLVVNLCANVLPTVPRNELVCFFSLPCAPFSDFCLQLSSNSGFGVIHAAILSLAARSLGQGRTFERVIPNGDAEVQESNVYAFGHGGVSKFDLKVRRKEELLRKAIISYIGSASDFTGTFRTLVCDVFLSSCRNRDQLGPVTHHCHTKTRRARLKVFRYGFL
jgi:nuclear pore complex protein Nup205